MGEPSELERRLIGLGGEWDYEGCDADRETVLEAAAAIAGLREACQRWAGADGGAGLHLDGCEFADGLMCTCGLDDARKALAALSAAPGREGVDGGHDV